MLLEVLYLALPAFVANMMPVVAARFNLVPFLDRPIDAHASLRGKPLLGRNKTWRGVVAAVVGGVAIAVVQYVCALPLHTVTTTAFDSLAIAIGYGMFVGILVMFGDALGSIVKRQLNIQSGAPCIPLDQVDYIVIFILGTLFVTSWSVPSSAVLIGATFFLNLGANAFAYVIGIKNTYW